MNPSFQARWISKKHTESLRKSGARKGLLLDTFKGFIVVEPKEEPLGDGEVLSSQEADFEVRPEWCLAPRSKITEARRLLGLSEPLSSSRFQDDFTEKVSPQ